MLPLQGLPSVIRPVHACSDNYKSVKLDFKTFGQKVIKRTLQSPNNFHCCSEKMAFYDIQGQPDFIHDLVMLQDMDDVFADPALASIVDTGTQNIGMLDYSDNDYSQDLTYTNVFRASDMNTVMPCVNGVQHLSSAPSSPPITPEMEHDDHADVDSDCTSCVECRQTATEKKAKRRQQNRESQRKFRARKEAKLSDAKSRIRDLEALVKAQEKTNIELKLTIEELNSGQPVGDTNARRVALARASKQVSVRDRERNPCLKGTNEGQRGLRDPISWTGHRVEPSSTQRLGEES